MGDRLLYCMATSLCHSLQRLYFNQQSRAPRLAFITQMLHFQLMEVKDPAIAYNKQKMSIGEYLEMENASPVKHEYYKGEVFAMSGAKVPHNNISGNVYASLHVKLKGKKCKPFNSDQRIHIESNTLFTYPDISLFAEMSLHSTMMITMC